MIDCININDRLHEANLASSNCSDSRSDLSDCQEVDEEHEITVIDADAETIDLVSAIARHD